MDIKSAFSIISIAFSSFFFSSSLQAAEPPKTIALTQIVDHPAADSVREGVLKALQDNGFETGKTLNLIYENAQGSPVTATQIAKKFVALKPDLIISITTPSTQAMVKANENYNLPIVFAAVTDPVASGVVLSMSHPGGQVTGATDAAPIRQQLEFFKKVLPNLKTLGIVYNPGDNSSATPVQEARQAAKDLGITLVESTAFKTSDVPTATQQLIGQKVDAVFVPLDNTILSAMEGVLKVANQYKVPVVSSDKDSVKQGALASSGYTHFDTGYAAGKLAVQILQGAKPGDLPVVKPSNLNTYINSKSAKDLNITIPDEVLKNAEKI
jgi:putative ABC transport system substrate-binding protein